jgi:NADH:ubiquinone reductase (H+-translocating)
MNETTGAPKRPRVVVIGAGFGGMETAKALRDAPVHVTVIDRQNHYCFQPLLYQVATAALSPADVAWPIRHVLATQQNATTLREEVRSIDTCGVRRHRWRRRTLRFPCHCDGCDALLFRP